jgi:type II secretory pathway component PulM
VEFVELLTSFGPVGFGTVVLIILWKVIVQPELSAQRAQMQALEAHIAQLNDVSRQIRQAAGDMSAVTHAMTECINGLREVAVEFGRLRRNGVHED